MVSRQKPRKRPSWEEEEEVEEEEEEEKVEEEDEEEEEARGNCKILLSSPSPSIKKGNGPTLFSSLVLLHLSNFIEIFLAPFSFLFVLCPSSQHPAQ